MSFPIGVIFGILAMFCWGVADFLVAKVVRKISVFRTFVWGEIISVFLYFLFFLCFFKWPQISEVTFGIILACSFLHITAYLALYKSLQLGQLSVVTPISASWVVLTVLLCVIFLNETLTGAKLAGVALVVCAVILVSFKWQNMLRLKLKNIAAGADYAFLALLAFGIQYALVDYLVSELSWILPIFFIKAFSLPLLLLYSSTSGRDVSFPRLAATLIILIGLLEFLAFLGYSLGVNSEYTAIVAPITASSPIVTVSLAKIFFREAVDINQRIGIASFLVGLVLLSM
ncbi:MAG: EamA family transporter [Candidatus Hadarchaeaceae archaeon]